MGHQLIQLGDKCKKGHLISGDNAQFYVNRGTNCVRCKTCAKPTQQPNPAYKVGDICQRGHVIVDENIYIQRIKDRESVRCRRCRNEWAKERRLRKLEEVEARKPIAKELYAKLIEKIQEVKPKCFQRPYNFVDYDEEFPPTKAEAEILCSGCPLMMDCKAYAHAERPAHGVWGSEVWEDGKLRK